MDEVWRRNGGVGGVPLPRGSDGLGTTGSVAALPAGFGTMGHSRARSGGDLEIGPGAPKGLEFFKTR